MSLHVVLPVQLRHRVLRLLLQQLLLLLLLLLLLVERLAGCLCGSVCRSRACVRMLCAAAG
jgi:hypothetical protein